jgi:hypothetical protein
MLLARRRDRSFALTRADVDAVGRAGLAGAADRDRVGDGRSEAALLILLENKSPTQPARTRVQGEPTTPHPASTGNNRDTPTLSTTQEPP